MRIINQRLFEILISRKTTSFLGVVFDVDHDFEGPRASKAHLDTVNTNLSHHLRRPFSGAYENNQPTVFCALSGGCASAAWSSGVAQLGGTAGTASSLEIEIRRD